MAVSQMRRVQVLAHSSHRASLIRDLQDMEIIHINNLNEQEETASDAPIAVQLRETIRGLENDLSRLQSTIDYLANFEPKKGFMAGMLGGGPVLSAQDYKNITTEVAHGEWRNICTQCQSLQDQSANSVNRESRLRSDRENLSLWNKLDVPLEEISDTDQTAIRIGVIPISTYNNLLADLASSEVDIAFERVGETKTEIQVVAIFLKADEQAATSLLTRYGFSPVSLPLSSGKISERLKGINDEISEISSERSDIEKSAAQFAVHRSKLMAIYDHITELLDQERTRESFLTTEHTFMVDGWVRKKDVKKLEDELSHEYDEIDITTSEPTKDDEPPVDLKIRGPADPFQMVTKLYGTPQYREIDPTPLIAPFFAFFFGICITDAGYGFLVAIVAILGAWKITGGGKNLFKLLIYAGLATIVVGAMVGGWFGLKPEQLPSFLKSLQILDPQGKDQMLFLALVVVIGFIQVWFGFFVKLYIDFRERDWGAAFFDELPWVLAMLLGVVAALLWRMGAPKPAMMLVMIAIALCCLIIFLFAGRESSNPVARLGTGGFELYTKLTGTFGDVLSYLRLFALGLATGIIAGVINEMASMLWGNPIGKVMAVGIFVGGHIFNLVINALGGFIHTARLQFVEFFTKFYEGGGEEFRPFKREHTYVRVVDLENPQESK